MREKSNECDFGAPKSATDNENHVLLAALAESKQSSTQKF